MISAPLCLPEFVPLARATVKGHGVGAHRIFSFEPWFRQKLIDDRLEREQLEAEAERVIAFLGGLT